MIAPCMDCPDRHEACHDACARYREWNRQHQEALQAKKAEKDSARSVYAGIVSRRENYRRSMKRKGISKI